MAEVQDPAFLQGGSHTARNDRAWSTTVLDPNGGVRTPGSLKVTTGSGMSVNVSAGAGWTPEAGLWQGVYHLLSDTTVNLPLSASDPTNGRIDLVVAQVNDAAYAGSENSWELRVIEGASSPSPSSPPVPPRVLPLARVAVGAGVSTLSGSDITDARPAGGLRNAGATTGTFLPLVGGNLTGALTLPGAPTSSLQAATKGYVDDSGPFPVTNIVYGSSVQATFPSVPGQIKRVSGVLAAAASSESIMRIRINGDDSPTYRWFYSGTDTQGVPEQDSSVGDEQYIRGGRTGPTRFVLSWDLILTGGIPTFHATYWAENSNAFWTGSFGGILRKNTYVLTAITLFGASGVTFSNSHLSAVAYNH